jgi:2'-5' RNA ligase
MPRVFVAVRLPAALARGIAAVQQELAPRLVDVKWVETENLHFTLRFFGELEAPEIDRVRQVVTEVTQLATPFTVALEGIGTFPERGRPRVIWAGMAAGGERMVELARALDAAFVAAELGRADRPFTPHLTLGRVRDPGRDRGRRGGGRREIVPPQAAVAMRAAVAGARYGPAELAVREVAVVESLLSPRGPTYRDLQVAELGGGKGGET